jgi:hypothetical protein
MSKRIPAKFKAQLGGELSKWYRLFGKVQPRKPYHEDDTGEGAATSKPLFAEHPLLAEMPIGASSDLTSIITNDEHTLEEAANRSDELTEELRYTLSMELERKNQKKFLYENYMKPH